MRQIKLLSGLCGIEAQREDGSVYWIYKRPSDEPFFCPDEQANRMIRSGQAQPMEEFEPDPVEILEAEQDDLETLTVKELKAMAKSYELEFSSHTTKAELIEALREVRLDG